MKAFGIRTNPIDPSHFVSNVGFREVFFLTYTPYPEENPWRTQNAYGTTQPVPIFHESDEEEEDSD